MDATRKITREIFAEGWADLNKGERDAVRKAVHWCIVHQSQLPMRRMKAIPERQMMEILEDVVAQEFGRPLSDLQRRDKRRIIVDERNMVMLLYKSRVNATLVETGKAFNLTHSTVIHGLNSAKFLIDFDAKYYDKFYSLKRKIDKKCEDYLMSFGPDGSSPELF